ncbi:MAG: hypothetical protein ABIR77_07495 [Sphingomicrobium sp.]
MRPAHRAVHIAEQQQRETELLGGERHRQPVNRDGARTMVEARAKQFLDPGFDRGLVRPSQERVDSGGQSIFLDRLGDIIIGTSLQQFDDVALLGTAGDHDHPRALLEIGARPAQQVDSVEVGQVPVEQEQVERVLAKRLGQRTAVAKEWQLRSPASGSSRSASGTTHRPRVMPVASHSP